MLYIIVPSKNRVQKRRIEMETIEHDGEIYITYTGVLKMILGIQTIILKFIKNNEN